MVENVQRVSDQRQDEMEDIEVITLSLSRLDEYIDSGMLDHGLVLNGIMFALRHLNRMRR